MKVVINVDNYFENSQAEYLLAKTPRNRKPDFASPNNSKKAKSFYWYTKEGVFRQSNHWGKVANCIWSLKHLAGEKFRFTQMYTGFCKWEDFQLIENQDKA